MIISQCGNLRCNGDRMNVLRNRILRRKDSPVHSASLDWRKTILVVFLRFHTACCRSIATDFGCWRHVCFTSVELNRSTQHPFTLIRHVGMACIWRDMHGHGSCRS